MPDRAKWAPRLLVLSLALGGLRDPRLFAVAGTAAWAAVWLERPPVGPAAAWLPWLGWALMSTLVSSQPLAGLPVLARWSTVLACASLAGAWTARQREVWLRSFLAVAVILGVAALATGAGRDWTNAMTGLIPPYYNYSAFVLAAAAAASAAWILHPRGARGLDRIGAGAVAALSLTCVVLARSRGAWLGLGVGAVLWTARRWGPRATMPIALAAALFAAGLMSGRLPSSVEAILFKKYRIHAEARPRLWLAAAGVATDRPLVGTGPGNFAVGFRRRPAAYEDGGARWAMSTDYAHSEPLQAAAETGWAGLALWLLGAGAAMLALFRRADEDPVREAAAAAAAAMTAQLLSDNMLQIPALAALWLSALTLASAPPAGAKRTWPRMAALLGATLAAISWISGVLAASGPERAAALFPADPGPREDLAYKAMAAGDTAEAERQWARARSLAPFDAIYPWRLAQLAAAAGRWEEAERLAANALALEPGFLEARLVRVEALVRLGRVSEARAALGELRGMLVGHQDVMWGSGYERAVSRFDSRDFDRLAALAGRPPLRP